MLQQSLAYPCGVIFFGSFVSFIFTVICLVSRVIAFQLYVLCQFFTLCTEHFLSPFPSIGFHWTDHLPTYILFDKATEVARFPEVTSESKVFVPKVTKVIFLTSCPFFGISLHNFTLLWNSIILINMSFTPLLRDLTLFYSLCNYMHRCKHIIFYICYLKNLSIVLVVYYLCGFHSDRCSTDNHDPEI